MLYSSIVKKRIRQSFDDVNNRRWDELMTLDHPKSPSPLRRRPCDRW